MGRGDSYQLQGQQGARIVDSAAGTITGPFRWLVALSPSDNNQLDTGTVSNITNATATLASIVFRQGVGIGGHFTAVDVAAGSFLCYYA